MYVPHLDVVGDGLLIVDGELQELSIEEGTNISSVCLPKMISDRASPEKDRNLA